MESVQYLPHLDQGGDISPSSQYLPVRAYHNLLPHRLSFLLGQLLYTCFAPGILLVQLFPCIFCQVWSLICFKCIEDFFLGNVNNGGRQQHPSGSGSDISRAATFGSASESSTPFISPQGTPIPFNRSRHNSAQGRLCRSRHSSGVPLAGGSYRYQTMPYSPMALNNLNNPFSPQPSTPIGQPDIAEPSYQSNINQFVSPPEDPRSRHSSNGSDTAPRSAPLSPFNANNGQHNQMNQGRQRHQSAGATAGATATIHYRPAQWQPINGEPTLQTEFTLNNEVSSLLTDNMSERGQYNYSQSQPATPGGGIESGGPPPGYSYSVIGVTNTGNHSHHSSYRNTPIPQVFY